MRTSRAYLLGLLLSGLALVAEARPLRVVTTTPELASITAAIGGENVLVRSISSGREDPHFLNARPTFMVMARDADLWIRMGMELEIGWEPVILASARNPQIRVGQARHLDVSHFADYALEVPDATATRAMGDVHAAGNPHFILDPYNARLVANGIAQRLIRIDASNRAAYEAGLAAFQLRLAQSMFGKDAVAAVEGETLWNAQADGKLDAVLQEAGVEAGGWVAAMAPAQGRPIVSFHKSWSYLAHRFGFRVAAELEPLPGVPPTPAHLARMVELVRAENIRIILKEPFYPARPANLVASQTDAKVVVVNSFATDTSADGYFNWMDAIIAAFDGV